jgi:hypothetical protein
LDELVGIKFVDKFSGKFFNSRFPIHKVRQFLAGEFAWKQVTTGGECIG